MLRQGGRSENRRRRREAAQAGAPSFAEAAADAACRAELHRRLVRLVLALPEPQRTVVLLHYFDGLAVAAVAARTRLSADAVRAHLHRAREGLRARLERAGGDAARGLGLLLASVPTRGLLLVMSAKTKLALAAGVLAAVVLTVVWWPSVPVAPPVGESFPPATLAGDATAAAEPAPRAPADTQRTVLAPAPAATGRELTVRLQGLLPHVPWTARLRLDVDGKAGADWHEHEGRLAVAGAIARTRVPHWVATAAQVKLRLDARDPFYLPVAVRREGDAARAREIEVEVQPVGRLSGRVVDARGAGVEAVRVAAFAIDGGRPRDVITGETTTRGDGTFTLQSRIEGPLLLVALPMQAAQISGRHLVLEGGGVADAGVPRDDLLPASTVTEVRHGAERELAALVAGDPALVTGSVHLATGTPVAGALVQGMDSALATGTLQETEGSRLTIDQEALRILADGSVLRWFARLTAAEDGTFRMPVTRGRQVWLAVLGAPAIDFLQRPHTVISAAPGAVRIELPGRLLTIAPTHRGTPIGKHMLTIQTMPGNASRPTEAPCTVLADAGTVLDGRIEADGFESARLQIDVDTAPATVAVEMVPIELVRLRLDLAAATRVRQAVLHFDRLDREAPSLRRSVFRNDGEAWFEVAVPPGRYRLRIAAPARGERRDHFVLPSSHDIAVGRDPAPLRIPAGHGGRIRLEVVDARGLPLRGTAELTRDGVRVPVLWKALGAHGETAGRAGEQIWHDGPHALHQPIPAGRYLLAVTAAGRDRRQVEVAVEEFEVAEVRVRY